MKYIASLWMIIVSLTLSSTGHATECTHPLKAGWEYWPPYQYVNKSGKLVGLDTELLKATAEEAGCRVHFYERPWKRHLLQIKNSELDIAMGASYEEARAEYAHFSDPIRLERVSLIVLQSKAQQYKITSLKDVTNSSFNIGATRGYYYGEEYKKLMNKAAFKAHVEEMHNDQINYNKLFRGRIDGFLADPVSMIHQLPTLREAKPLALLFDINSADVHLMFSKSSVDEKIVSLFNSALERLKNSGAYQAIMDKYLDLDKVSQSTLQASTSN